MPNPPPTSSSPRLRAAATAFAFAALALGGTGAVGVGAARAGSFQINEQSVSGLGTAYAGGAAVADDPSTLFFNPAGAALLPQPSSQTGLHYIHPRAEFDNQGSSYGNAFPIRGSDGGGAGRGALVPNGFYTFPIQALLPRFTEPGTALNNRFFSDLTFGLAFTAPWGLVTNYDPNYVGRYFATRSKLYTTDIAPSVSFKLFDRLSVGAGLDVQYAAARLAQAVDFGLIGFARVPGGAALGFRPGQQDGSTELYGDDWSVGWNGGVILEFIKKGEHLGPLDDARLGFSYRSGITHTLDGYVKFNRVPAGFDALGFVGQDASADLKLPEVFHFSLYQRFLRRFAIVGDLAWTRWSRLQTVPINYSNPVSQANLATDPRLGRPGLDLKYSDAFRYAGGFEFYPTDKLTLRVGAAYDQSPITNKETRSPRIPDGDRVFVGTGFKYTVASFNAPIVKHVEADIDFGYAHLFVPNDPQVDVTDTQLHRLVGSYNAHVDIVSASLTLRYGPREQAPRPAPKEGKDGKATVGKSVPR